MGNIVEKRGLWANFGQFHSFKRNIFCCNVYLSLAHGVRSQDLAERLYDIVPVIPVLREGGNIL